MSSASSNSTRISKRFAELRTSGELGIVAYITAGDPSLDATQKFVLELAETDADVIELGVPFSDPLADGPTIQRASERCPACPLQLLQSHFANGPRKIRRRSRSRWGRRRSRYRPYTRGIRRLSPHSRGASSRYDFPRRAHFHVRASR